MCFVFVTGSSSLLSCACRLLFRCRAGDGAVRQQAFRHHDRLRRIAPGRDRHARRCWCRRTTYSAPCQGRGQIRRFVAETPGGVQASRANPRCAETFAVGKKESLFAHDGEETIHWRSVAKKEPEGRTQCTQSSKKDSPVAPSGEEALACNGKAEADRCKKRPEWPRGPGEAS